MGGESEGGTGFRPDERVREAMRAINAAERQRLQSYLDSLDHGEFERARPYIGQPLEITLIKMALRLEQHIETTDHNAAVAPWRVIGTAFGAAVAGAVAAGAAVREALK